MKQETKNRIEQAIGITALSTFVFGPLLADFLGSSKNINHPVAPDQTVRVSSVPKEKKLVDSLPIPRKGVLTFPKTVRDVLTFLDEEGRLVAVPKMAVPSLSEGDFVTIQSMHVGPMGQKSIAEAKDVVLAKN